jgi:hypothetical protein
MAASIAGWHAYFEEPYEENIGKGQKSAIRVRSLISNRGLSPGACQRIQVAAVQAVVLYGSDLWWRGQKDRVQEVHQQNVF